MHMVSQGAEEETVGCLLWHAAELAQDIISSYACSQVY